MFKVGIIVGSIRKDSINLKLAKALEKLGKGLFEAKYLQIGELPLYNQDLEASFPQEATNFKNDIINSDALLIVTPEFNRSIPGPLKNALDWASRPYGKNALKTKPVAICGASPGAIGTACSQHDLRPILSYLDVILMGQPEIYLQFKDDLIDEEGNISNKDTQKFLQDFMNQYASWVSNHLHNNIQQDTAKKRA
jgi:chromate reductase